MKDSPDHSPPFSFFTPGDPQKPRREAADHGRNLACWNVASLAINLIKGTCLQKEAVDQLDEIHEKLDEASRDIRKGMPDVFDSLMPEFSDATEAYKMTVREFRKHLEPQNTDS